MIRRNYNELKSITIRFKDGEPDLLEVEEQNTISIEHRFLDVIAKNGFRPCFLKYDAIIMGKRSIFIARNDIKFQNAK